MVWAPDTAAVASTSPHDPRWRVVDRTPWPWSSPGATVEAAEAQPERGLEAAEVAVVVGPVVDDVVAERSSERRAGARPGRPPSSSSSAPPGPQEAGGLGDDAPQHVGPVGPAVVVRGVLEAQGVAREERERGGGDVGHDGHDDVGAVPAATVGSAAKRSPW